VSHFKGPHISRRDTQHANPRFLSQMVLTPKAFALSQALIAKTHQDFLRPRTTHDLHSKHTHP